MKCMFESKSPETIKEETSKILWQKQLVSMDFRNKQKKQKLNNSSTTPKQKAKLTRKNTPQNTMDRPNKKTPPQNNKNNAPKQNKNKDTVTKSDTVKPNTPQGDQPDTQDEDNNQTPPMSSTTSTERTTNTSKNNDDNPDKMEHNQQDHTKDNDYKDKDAYGRTDKKISPPRYNDYINRDDSFHHQKRHSRSRSHDHTYNNYPNKRNHYHEDSYQRRPYD